jgi:hypothetical protein
MVTQLNRNEILSHSNTTLARWRPLTFHLLLAISDGYTLAARLFTFALSSPPTQTLLTLIIITSSNLEIKVIQKVTSKQTRGRRGRHKRLPGTNAGRSTCFRLTEQQGRRDS